MSISSIDNGLAMRNAHCALRIARRAVPFVTGAHHLVPQPRAQR
jgi:hypothetical protein